MKNLIVLLVAGGLVAYGEEQKPLTLEALANWQQKWAKTLTNAKNPIERSDLGKKKQEEYDSLIKGKPIEGIATVFGIGYESRTGNVTLTLMIKIPKVMAKMPKKGMPLETFTFIVFVENNKDPFLKTLTRGSSKTEASKVKVSGVLDKDNPNGNRILKGKIKPID